MLAGAAVPGSRVLQPIVVRYRPDDPATQIRPSAPAVLWPGRPAHPLAPAGATERRVSDARTARGDPPRDRRAAVEHRRGRHLLRAVPPDPGRQEPDPRLP